MCYNKKNTYLLDIAAERLRNYFQEDFSMRYIGETCALCGLAFTESDDVVVCPECGSPHHRSCYSANNCCANAELHTEGYKWQRNTVNKKVSDADVDVYIDCPRCGSRNSTENSRCIKCGAPLSEAAKASEGENQTTGNPFLDQIMKLDPNENIGGIRLKEAVGFVRSNLLYYIPMFRQMFAMGRKISFNIICFIFPPIYFANRRMWSWAILTAVLSVLLSMPLTISYFVSAGLENGGISLFSQSVNDAIMANRHTLSTLVDICNVADLGMRILMCMFGNYIYYKFMIKSVKRIKASAGDDAPAYLVRAGGVKPLNSLLIIIIMFAMTMAATLAAQYLLEAFL